VSDYIHIFSSSPEPYLVVAAFSAKKPPARPRLDKNDLHTKTLYYLCARRKYMKYDIVAKNLHCMYEKLPALGFSGIVLPTLYSRSFRKVQNRHSI